MTEPSVPATRTSTSRPSFRGRRALEEWVLRMAALTQPDRIVWLDGSEAEEHRLINEMLTTRSLIPLDPQLRPGSYLARSDPEDVARVEDRTFICSEAEVDAGPTNNWCDPEVMRRELELRFTGAMRGRSMYVVPFSMGPIGGAISQLGVQITDSPYVALSTRVMTRVGAAALAQVGPDTEWVPAAHTVGMPLITAAGDTVDDVPWPSNSVKIIAHFPTTREIWSHGSGYGGNAMLAKKCFALRIASVMAHEQGWLAEHMLIVRLTTPEGRSYNIAAAFPSACGKTNFAMLTPTRPGWTVETIGDDIAWLRPGADGRLWAINPEAGFFGVAPGTSEATNPAAMQTMRTNTIFTNTALTPQGDVWWEGKTAHPPAKLTDWRGQPWTPDSGRLAAHPNARFTSPADQCPTLSEDWAAADGVPIDAIVFGGRRTSTIPLVSEAVDWSDGVFMGATIASEQTAAAEGPVGALRFDPFAMRPFCGYNMADHWAHWLDIGTTLAGCAPKVFRVNWFLKDEAGAFVWPGFGENIRVLEWIVARLEGGTDAVSTPIGLLPHRNDLDLDGLDLTEDGTQMLLTLDRRSWQREASRIGEHFSRFEDRLPPVLGERLRRLQQALEEYA